MLIAFAYNLRHTYANIDDPKSQLEADFDDPQTIDAMVKHLEKCGYDVLKVEANERAYLKLYKNRKKIDLLFNYSLGINGKDRYSHIPAMCEMLKIPYTGSGPLTEASTMNKARSKEVLIANGVPTLPFQLFENENEKLKKGLSYPLIVKPVAQGCSAGITNKSVVNNLRELKKQIKWSINLFREPALVEPFLKGREFSVGMLGNPPQILPIIESDHSFLPKGFQPMDSLEVKWQFEIAQNSKNLICPAKIDKNLKAKIEKICLATWSAERILDVCRIDLRCDEKGNVYVLEVNSPPGLYPEEIYSNSYFLVAARAFGIKYDDILKRIINSALERYKKSRLRGNLNF